MIKNKEIVQSFFKDVIISIFEDEFLYRYFKHNLNYLGDISKYKNGLTYNPVQELTRKELLESFLTDSKMEILKLDDWVHIDFSPGILNLNSNGLFSIRVEGRGREGEEQDIGFHFMMDHNWYDKGEYLNFLEYFSSKIKKINLPINEEVLFSKNKLKNSVLLSKNKELDEYVEEEFNFSYELKGEEFQLEKIKPTKFLSSTFLSLRDYTSEKLYISEFNYYPLIYKDGRVFYKDEDIKVKNIKSIERALKPKGYQRVEIYGDLARPTKTLYLKYFKNNKEVIIKTV